MSSDDLKGLGSPNSQRIILKTFVRRNVPLFEAMTSFGSSICWFGAFRCLCESQGFGSFPPGGEYQRAEKPLI